MLHLMMMFQQDIFCTQKRQLYQYMCRPSMVCTHIRLRSSRILLDSLFVFVIEAQYF